MTDLPDGFVLDQPPPSPAQGLPEGFVPDQFSGSILPWSKNAQGQVSFDPNAGFLGGIQKLAQAAAAPGNVYSGALPTPYSGKGSTEASPEVLDQARNFALGFSPTSVASRAGVIPGLASTTPVPTAQQLKSAADVGYNAARASPLSVPGDAVANMAQGVQQTLQNDHGVIEETAPKTFAILNKLANPPKVTPTAGAAEIHPNPPGFDVHTNGPAGVLYADTMQQAQDMANRYGLGANDNVVLGTYPGLEAARRGLSALKAEGSTEGYAAGKAIPELDKFIDTISPDAAAARANMAAAFRSNNLTGDLSRANTGILEQAEARAAASHSGANLDNSIRQRIASFLQVPENLSGYSQPEIDALNDLVKGSTTRNAARFIGNYLGGNRGVASLAASGVGAVLGGHLGLGTEGAVFGATLPPALGTSAKSLENSLARRALEGVDETVRSRSPLAQSMASQQIPSTGLNNATYRSPSLMISQPPAPAQRLPMPLSLASPSSLAEILAKRAHYY